MTGPARTAVHRPAVKRRRFRHDSITALDLFSGFGGLTQGIERAGFDVNFPDHEGTFICWGSERDQTDGFGNAVSPPVGWWIGDRLRAVLHREQVAS